MGHWINFGLQTLLVVLGLVAGFMAIGESRDSVILLYLVQFAIGVTQLISGLIYTIMIKRWAKRLRIMWIVYWGAVLLYAIGATGGIFFVQEDPSFVGGYSDAEEITMMILLSAWLIAFYQYVLIIMHASAKKQQMPQSGDPFYQGHWPME